MHRIIFSLIFLLQCKAQYYSSNEGPCPVISPVENFNITQFAQGKWYHLFQSANDQLHLSGQMKCPEKHFYFDADVGTFVLDSYGITEDYHKPVWMKTYGFASKPPGLFRMMVHNASLPYESLDFVIIDADKENYTVGYFCGYCQKTNTSFVSAGICSRTPHLASASTVQNAAKIFKTYGLNINFIAVNWSDCRARCRD